MMLVNKNCLKAESFIHKHVYKKFTLCSVVSVYIAIFNNNCGQKIIMIMNDKNFNQFTVLLDFI